MTDNPNTPGHADAEGRSWWRRSPRSAALVVLRAARLDTDRLEVELIDAVRDAGLDWAQIAAVLDLPDDKAAQQRYEELRPSIDAPVDSSEPPPPHVNDA